MAHLNAQAQARPLLLVIDDLQWTDVGLQEILAELLERRRDRRWVVLLASRTDEAGPTALLPTTVAQLALVPLPADEVDALVRHTAPGLHEDAVAACVRRSAGNPFFAIELARQHAASTDGESTGGELPVLILELLDARLARCSPQVSPAPLPGGPGGRGVERSVPAPPQPAGWRRQRSGRNDANSRRVGTTPTSLMSASMGSVSCIRCSGTPPLPD